MDFKDKNIRWLHLSDFHVGKDDYAQRKLFSEIIEYVSGLSAQNFFPDLIFITGDIANSGNLKQYESFLSDFLTPLIHALPDYAMDRIFIVPGNHDVIRNTHKYFSRDEIMGNESRFFDPTESGLNERKQLLPRFADYIEANIPPTNWLDSENGFFGHKLNIRGVQIGIAGINTAWLSKTSDRHCLTPGIDILEDVLNKLNDTEIKIVLGHHPVDWFDDNHVAPIRSLLCRHNALYLHGHLHKNRANPEDGAGYGFLSVQSGAAFQSRRDEKWVNGFMLAELVYSTVPTLRLQPREWNPDSREWSLSKNLPERRKINGTDWWGFPLPADKSRGNSTPNSSSIEDSLRYPNGWQLIDSDYIKRQKGIEGYRNYLNYIDGSEPDWGIVVSDLLPARSIVSELIDKLMCFTRKGKPQVVLLTGPVGEGKSTAIMQAVAEMSKSNLNILWNQGEKSSLKHEEVVTLPITDTPWLFVSDSADLIAHDLKTACQALSKYQRNDVRFLICCRDTDWKAIKAHTWKWNSFSFFSNIILSGLKYEDASKIVEFWGNVGEEALGNLDGLKLEDATSLLLQAAHQESPRREGALIGAILKVRYGDLLKEHIKALLNRLSSRSVPGGGTLFDAFGYIAAMHAENLKYLSRPVLAEALCCPIESINAHVLIPLGMEAATSSDGQFLLTRHRTIAELCIELMQDVYQVDMDQIYYEIIDAALTAKFGNYVPLLPRWLYSYPGHFGQKGRYDLAIRFGKRVQEKTPNNSTLIKSLSTIYRAAGNNKEASELFRNYKGKIFEERGYYCEWGAAEGASGEFYYSPFLLLYSLSDQVSKLPPKKQLAIKAASSLFTYFKEIGGDYLDAGFLRARNSCRRIKEALQLEDKKTEEENNGGEDQLESKNKNIEVCQYDISEDLNDFVNGVKFSLNYFAPMKEEGLNDIIDVNLLTFSGLLKLMKSAEQIAQHGRS